MNRYRLMQDDDVKEVKADYFETDGNAIEFYEKSLHNDELLYAYAYYKYCEKIEEGE